jgi:hypothetical protein
MHDDNRPETIMTLSELLLQTSNQISLLRTLVDSHGEDLKAYPTSKYSIQSRISVEHCYDTLLRLNNLLATPIESDEDQ